MKKLFRVWLVISVLMIIATGCNRASRIEQFTNDNTNEDYEVVNNEKAGEQGKISQETSSYPPMVTLVITRDFGKEELYRSKAELKKNMTVYDLLLESVTVDSDYGGSFITGINGLTTQSKNDYGERTDWFYYVNGICADVGAIDHDLINGDIVWWDYHSWENMDSMNSAVTGSFPQPFINGYRNNEFTTTILYSDDFEPLANKLKDGFYNYGLDNVIISRVNNELIENRQGPTIVLGTWQELKKYEYINNMNDNYTKLGTYIHFEDGQVQLFSSDNSVKETIKKDIATIFAHGDGLGDDSVLWLIVGIDKEDLGSAIDKVIEGFEHEEIFGNTYSVYISEGQVHSLPLN